MSIVPHTPPSPRTATLRRRRRHVLAVAATIATALVVGPAVALEPPASSEPGSPDAGAVPDDDRLTIAKIHGRAFQIGSGGRYVSLRNGDAVDVNRPVKVGPRSRLDVRLRDGGTMELGPGAELVLFPVSHAGRDHARVTGLRLDQGYVRVAIAAQAPGERFELSFGRWSAQLELGEYVFEAQEREAAVCTISGSLRLSGVPEWTAAPEPAGCVQLAGRPPQRVSLDETERSAVLARRALSTVLAQASRRTRDDAIARLEATYAAPTPAPAGEDADAAQDKMPGTDRVALEVPRALGTATLDASLRRLDRQIERQQDRLAAALIASAPVEASAEQPAPGEARGPALASPAEAATPGPEPRTESPSPPPLEKPDPGDAAPAAPDAAPPVVAAAATAITADAPIPPASAATTSVAPAVETPAPSLEAAVAVSAGQTARATADAGSATQGTPPTPDIALASPVAAPPAEAGGLVRVSLAPASAQTGGVDAVAPASPALEWIVNVATYASLQSAEQQAEQLRAQNFRTSIRRETVRGRTSYRVVVEGLSSETAAYAAQQALVSQYGLRQAWVFRKY